jgi:hypothetical protein
MFMCRRISTRPQTSSIALSALLVLGACDTPTTTFQSRSLADIVPAWCSDSKSQAECDNDVQVCKIISANRQSVIQEYGQCMVDRGDIILYTDGQYYYPPVAAVTPTPPPPPEPLPGREETPSVASRSPPEIAIGGPAASRFQDVLHSHQELLLLAAHPSGVINDSNVAIQQADSHRAILADDINWHGPSGKQFRIIFTFTLAYDDQNTIDTVTMSVEEIGNPFPAFLAANIAKQAILHYASDKVESRAAKVLIKVFNAETSIESGLSLALKEMANS